MGCSSFNDKYQECEFLIEELELIILQSSSNNYTENEQKAIDKLKFEKKYIIQAFIDKLEKSVTDEIQKRKVQKFKNDLKEIDEEDNYESNSDIN